MARSMWRGAVQFGLVTIPVKLYLATESNAGLSFNLLHKTCLTRVQMRTWCPYHEEYISRADTVRGFEYAKGQYVVIDDADLENVPLKTVRSIEIETFVPARRDGETAKFVKSAYYLEPEAVGRKAFYLLQDVLARGRPQRHLQDRHQGSRGAGGHRPVPAHDAAVDALLARRGPLAWRSWTCPTSSRRSSRPRSPWPATWWRP